MKFECVKCGGCCKQSGALRFLRSDILRLSDFFNVSFENFCSMYKVEHVYGRLYFVEIHDGCVFLNSDNTCAINSVKPFFCSNYIPFVDNEDSPIYEICKGIGKGKDWSEKEIKERYDKMLKNLVVVKDGDC